MLMRKAITALGAVLLLALATGALGGETAEAVVEVEIRDYRYEPQELEVPVGTTVRWVNAEARTSHDVYFPDEDIGADRFFPEESWERTFEEPGTYPYHCRPHEEREGMHGVITVVPAQ
jgi:plastocyanin